MAGRLAFTAVVIALIGVVIYVANHFTARRARARHAEVEGWDNWDTETRAAAARHLLLELVDDDAERTKNFIVYTFAVMVVGTWSLFAMQRQADELEHIVSVNCETSAGFRELQSLRLTEEIRQKQDRRDAVAQQIIVAQEDMLVETPLEEIPGFGGLSESAVEFVRAIAANNDAADLRELTDLHGRLDTLDEDLERLREEADVVRAFNIDANCP